MVKFKEHADKQEAESISLTAAAATGRLENLKAAFGPAAQICKSRHDSCISE